MSRPETTIFGSLSSKACERSEVFRRLQSHVESTAFRRWRVGPFSRKSKLDGKEEDIRMLLGKEVSKASIAKILDVSRSALYHFIETRKIGPGWALPLRPSSRAKLTDFGTSGLA